MSITHYCPRVYNTVLVKARQFFQAKGFLECYSQNRLSILAACEDPSTISTMNYAGRVWPLPQTQQMWLEHELLRNPDVPGLYSIGTSFRNEPRPVLGRHNLIFGMLEFEMRGDMEDLVKLESDFLEFLGFPKVGAEYPRGEYLDVAADFGVKELEHEHEAALEDTKGPVFFLTDFPRFTSPFWNMKFDEAGEMSKKVDVILHGVETIGSAERSCDKAMMKHMFETISDGQYADLLYSQFGRERVQEELRQFLSYDFFPRVGGGIGLERLIRALKLSGLLGTEDTSLQMDPKTDSQVTLPLTTKQQLQL